jgi:CDP-paratose 2-epimerase
MPGMEYKHILITGGAGFIGSNAAAHYLRQGKHVTIVDNLSRKGGDQNIRWLKSLKISFTFLKLDIQKPDKKLATAVSQADLILHLAGQVAVTTSVEDPREDFESNALGTLNMLELVRNAGHHPTFIYSSTNKVYGELKEHRISTTTTRYNFQSLKWGVSEKEPLDFHSPYGCSKGAADQYVRDYHRIYRIPTIVFRQSCIYGPRQFGIEDQGWLAWFMICTLKKKKVTIFGTGKQVRDVLYIDDLLKAYDLAAKHIDKTAGKIFNIGGGPKNSLSIWHELQSFLKTEFGFIPSVQFKKERAGDQPIYISDIRYAEKEFGWKPTVSIQTGLHKLAVWIKENKQLFL